MKRTGKKKHLTVLVIYYWVTILLQTYQLKIHSLTDSEFGGVVSQAHLQSKCQSGLSYHLKTQPGKLPTPNLHQGGCIKHSSLIG